MKILTPLFILGLFFSSCNSFTGTEIARIPINQISTQENIFEESKVINLLKDDKISFWSEMDMNYDGEASLQFSVGLFLNDELYEAMAFDPREKNMTIGEVKSNVNKKVKWKFTGKNKTYTVLEDGEYTIKTFFLASENVKIDKAELVIKK